MRPYFLGGGIGGGVPLILHENCVCWLQTTLDLLNLLVISSLYKKCESKKIAKCQCSLIPQSVAQPYLTHASRKHDMDSMPSSPSAVSVPLSLPSVMKECLGSGLSPSSAVARLFVVRAWVASGISTYTASLPNKPHANSSSNIFHLGNMDMLEKFKNTWAQNWPTNPSEQGGGLTANIHDEKPWKHSRRVTQISISSQGNFQGLSAKLEWLGWLLGPLMYFCFCLESVVQNILKLKDGKQN